MRLWLDLFQWRDCWIGLRWSRQSAGFRTRHHFIIGAPALAALHLEVTL